MISQDSSSPNIFVNRTLNMKRINYIGFDMDHTLVRYKSENFEALAYDAMLTKLIEFKSYPKNILNLKFDFDRTIRGLVIDKIRGNVLKLNRYGAIRMSYHGSSEIHYSLQKKLYKSTYIDLSDPDFDPIDTTFSISIGTLFAQLVDLKDGVENNNLPDYRTIYSDLEFVLDQAHRDGSIKNIVAENLENYIYPDPKIVHNLEKYKLHGKKVFVLTNSEFEYTKLLLDHTINPFLKAHGHWSELFEYVICSAQKPRFFMDNLSFLKIDPETGKMTNLNGKLSPGIYQGGCAPIFTSDLELNPDEILYIGDHIYGDILRLKKTCAWRTALVVDELDNEMKKLKETQSLTTQISELMSKKIPFEKKVDQLTSENIEQESKGNESKITELLAKIALIDSEIGPLIKTKQNIFNPLWGEIMRIGSDESLFASQVDRFACIYMAHLGDFLAASPRSYFRAQKRLMSHELRLKYRRDKDKTLP